MTDGPDRHNDTWRNAVLNKAVHSLDRIINRHDPDVDCPVNQGVWDFLDKLVLAFEERHRADTATPAPADPLADPRVVALAEVLRCMVYETTSLSPEEDDGSHWCKISKAALTEARAALAAITATEEGET